MAAHIPISTAKPISHRWWFRAALTLCLFLPAISAVSYDPAITTEVVRAVLEYPYVMSATAILPFAKLVLLTIAIVPFLRIRQSGRIVLGTYAGLLLVVAPLQNMADTDEFGFVWLVGNTGVQLIVAAWCFIDVAQSRTTLTLANMQRERLWLIAPMALALLMPYTVHSDHVTASLASVLWNEAGVTYCMITPVVLGVLLIFADGVDRRTLSVISYVGLLFGLLNFIVWFVVNPRDWWMGVLHLPLLITAIYGLLESRHR